MSLQKYKKRYPNFIDLAFTCSTEDRYIYVKNRKTEENFSIETPFLKVLKPVHNYKDKSYIILSINSDFDFNDEVNDFVYLINKLHEFSQENIKVDSKKWFGKDFDIFDLDNIVKRPIEEHKNNNYIKLVIVGSDVMENKLSNLEKDMYIKCNIEFHGLKISRDTLMEEWYVTDFITQEEFENQSNADNYKNIVDEDIVSVIENIEQKQQENDIDESCREDDIVSIVQNVNNDVNNNNVNNNEVNDVNNNEVNDVNNNEVNNNDVNEVNDNVDVNNIEVNNIEVNNNDVNNEIKNVNDKENVSVDVVSLSTLPSTESKRKHKKISKTNLITRRKIFTIEK